MAYKPVFAFNTSDAMYTLDEAVLKAVYKCDVYVDKEELLKALQYDRGQYQKGHADGYKQALADVKRLMETYDVTFGPLENLSKEKSPMPNIVHLPICPFYKYEKRKSVCCEDTYRGFKSAEDKYSWMHMYCDSWDWMRCPYAVDLNEAYERLEKGDDKALEKLERDAMKKEMKSLSTKLGRAEKKIERLQKKLDESKELVKSYQRKNEDLYRKWRSLDDKVRKDDDKIWNELGSLSEIYEQRMAYLIDTCCPDKRLYEEDVEAWAKDKEFALVFDRDDVESNPFRRTWKVVFKEDGQQDQNIQADVQEGQEIRQQESAD